MQKKREIDSLRNHYTMTSSINVKTDFMNYRPIWLFAVGLLSTDNTQHEIYKIFEFIVIQAYLNFFKGYHPPFFKIQTS